MKFFDKLAITFIYRDIIELQHFYRLIAENIDLPLGEPSDTIKSLNDSIYGLTITEYDADDKDQNFVEFTKYLKNRGSISTEDDVNKVYDVILKVLRKKLKTY